MILGRAIIEGVGPGGGLLDAVDRLPVRPGIVAVWSSWDNGTPDGPPGAAFPSRIVAGLRDRGIRPLVNWQPAGPGSEHAAIVRGDHDAYLIAWADELAAGDGPVWVRFAWEANGDGRPAWAARSRTHPANSAPSYVAAWRHVARILRRRAPLARLVWCVDAGRPGAIAPLWPGRPFVDVAALDGYAWRVPLRAPAAILGPALAVVRQLTGLPVWIAETGCTAEASPAARRAWARALRAWGERRGIAAACWFDIDMSERNPAHPDWRLGAAADAWR